MGELGGSQSCVGTQHEQDTRIFLRRWKSLISATEQVSGNGPILEVQLADRAKRNRHNTGRVESRVCVWVRGERERERERERRGRKVNSRRHQTHVPDKPQQAPWVSRDESGENPKGRSKHTQINRWFSLSQSLRGRLSSFKQQGSTDFLAAVT